jgi:hypothetical protein
MEVYPVDQHEDAYLEGSEVDDIVDVWVLIEDLVQCRLVCDVNLIEDRSLAANELDSIDNFWRGIVEIVDDDDLVISLEKGKSREGANVARATVKSQPLRRTQNPGAQAELKVGWSGVYPVTRTDPTTILNVWTGRGFAREVD